jgi:hypothetical protein
MLLLMVDCAAEYPPPVCDPSGMLPTRNVRVWERGFLEWQRADQVDNFHREFGINRETGLLPLFSRRQS